MGEAFPPVLLSVSIVVFQSDPGILAETVTSLAKAVAALPAATPFQGRATFYLIDNDDRHEAQEFLKRGDLGWALEQFDAVELLAGHGNVGYGRGHNLAIKKIHSRYHLILNPDVVLAPDALLAATAYLDAHPEIGLLSPQVFDQAGQRQYLCRRYPTLLDLGIRGFLPTRWRVPFAGRLERYEMRDLIGGENIVPNPPLVSGCFMFFRTEVLKLIGGFDPAYFLYFEDYDLSIRTSQRSALAYVPSVSIRHLGGGASRKGHHHTRLFLGSALRFFSTHGWRFW